MATVDLPAARLEGFMYVAQLDAGVRIHEVFRFRDGARGVVVAGVCLGCVAVAAQFRTHCVAYAAAHAEHRIRLVIADQFDRKAFEAEVAIPGAGVVDVVIDRALQRELGDEVVVDTGGEVDEAAGADVHRGAVVILAVDELVAAAAQADPEQETRRLGGRFDGLGSGALHREQGQARDHAGEDALFHANSPEV
jgi:hypothetical protein